MIGQITGEMEKLFRDSFERLNTYFGETFRALFGGGQAFIKLEDEGNILESGIDMHVQPPGKKLQLLTLLSGGCLLYTSARRITWFSSRPWARPIWSRWRM